MTSEAAVAVRPLQSGGAEDSAKRRQILDGARAIFLSRGFDAASMARSPAAGVSKGTLYVYFESKEELFEAIVHQQCEAQAESLFDLNSGDGDVDGVLTRLGIGFIGFLCRPEKSSSLRTVIAIADRMPEIGKKFYETGPSRGIAMLAAYLERQVDAASGDDDCETRPPSSSTCASRRCSSRCCSTSRRRPPPSGPSTW
jgi:AcrR family transcriptional regulator